MTSYDQGKQMNIVSRDIVVEVIWVYKYNVNNKLQQQATRVTSDRECKQKTPKQKHVVTFDITGTHSITINSHKIQFTIDCGL